MEVKVWNKNMKFNLPLDKLNIEKNGKKIIKFNKSQTSPPILHLFVSPIPRNKVI